MDFKVNICDTTGMIHVYQRGHDIHNYNELLNENKNTKSIKSNGYQFI